MSSYLTRLKGLVYIFSFLISLLAYSQQWLNPYRVYDSEEYEASAQNWAAAQDSKGRMYFANTNTILKFNGQDWEKIEMGNSSLVTAISIDSADNIIVGGYKEFGELKPNSIGKLEYHSYVPDSLKAYFNRIWKIEITQDSGTYFAAYERIFRYYQKELTEIASDSGRFFMIYKVDDKIITNGSEGLTHVNGSKLEPLPNAKAYIKMALWGLKEYDHQNYIGLARNAGVFLINKETFEFKALNEKFNKYITQQRPYTIEAINDKQFAIVTNLNGTIIIDRYGDIVQVYNSTTGASDDLGIGTYMANDQVLWFLGNNGISKILHDFSVEYYNSAQNLKPPIYDVSEIDGKLIIHTGTGIQTFQDGKFEYISKARGQSWKGFYEKEEDLFFAIVGAKFLAIQDGKIKFEDDRSVDYTFAVSKYHPKTIIKPYLNYMEVLSYDQNGFTSKYQHRTNLLLRRMIEFDPSRILFSTEEGKVGLMYLTKDTVSYEYFDEKYGINEDLPTSLIHLEKDHLILLQNNNIVYQFDTISHQLKPFDFEKRFDIVQKDIIRGVAGPKDQYGFVTAAGKVIWVKKLHNGASLVDSNSFNLFGSNLGINGIFFDSKGEFYVGTTKKVFKYKPQGYWNLQKAWDIELSSIQLGKDSLLFGGYFADENGNITSLQSSGNTPTITHNLNNLTFRYNGLDYNDPSRTLYSYQLENFDEDWSDWTTKNEKEYTNLFEGSYTFKVKAKNVFGRESETSSYTFEVLPPFYRTIWAYICYALFGIGFILTIIRINERRLKKENERLENIVSERTAEIEQQKEELQAQADNLAELNEELSQQKEEIQQQADELNSTNELLEDINQKIESRNKSITDSINYAKRIQDAMLPNKEQLDQIFKDHCLFYQPKDIVSGDFYWTIKKEDALYWAVIDCTGHGVPGGFMSMIGNSILNEIVNEQNITEVDEILNQMREKVIKSINGGAKNIHEAERKDGMDVALCKYDLKAQKLDFAGSNLNAYIFHKEELVEIQGDPQPVGAYKSIIPFQKHSFAVEEGDNIYIFTDGYPDQFGGQKYRKFKFRRMRKLLHEMQRKSLNEQSVLAAEVFKRWKGENQQTDDVSFFGVKI